MGRTRTTTVLEDDRNEAEEISHCEIVLGRDTCLSGWGEAEGKTSFAGWACELKDIEQVKEWVESRTDMRSVKIVDGDYIPSGSKWHLHIYVVNEGHPALNEIN